MMKSWKYYRDLVKTYSIYLRVNDLSLDKKIRKKAKKFYKKNGFYQEETWELNNAMASWLLPRLAYFRDKHYGTPPSYFCFNEEGKIINEEEGHKQYNKDLDIIIEALSLIVEDKINTESKLEFVNEGLQLLAKLWLSLWD